MTRVRLSPDELVGGRYKVVTSLGFGTSGEVFQCQDTLLGNRTVAVKLFAHGIAYDKTVQARIHRELRSIFRVRHDNVVAFYDIVNHKGLYGYAMEYAGGGTFERFKDPKEPLSLQWALTYLWQICNGLHAIHQCGLVHRDLKPANLLLSEDRGTVKITDLGLAREVDSSNGDKGMRGVTMQGQLIGTPRYLCPEYIEHGKADIRSDIYAVGLIGYELIARVPAYPGESVAELLIAKLKSPPPALRSVAPSCPESVVAIIDRATAHQPDDRYQTAGEMRDDLFRALSLTSDGFVDGGDVGAGRKGLVARRLRRLTADLLFIVVVGGAYLWVMFELVAKGR